MKFLQKIWESKRVHLLKRYLKKLVIPGFDGVPLFYVFYFLWQAILKGAIPLRASSIAFNFFLATFPAIIFVFTLLPYLPIDNFQVQLLDLLKDIMPANTYTASEEIIVDIINNERGGLLSAGFVGALYFSTNGINAMMSAFNQSVLIEETRHWVKQRLVAILLTVILTLLIISAGVLIIVSGVAIDYMVKFNIIKIDWTFYLLSAGQWIVILALFFFGISFIYFYGPAKKTKWRFISPGGIVATLLVVLASLGFSAFVSNFGQYNNLYGSIGTLMVVMMWININAQALLFGFELNASIQSGKVLTHGDEFFKIEEKSE